MLQMTCKEYVLEIAATYYPDWLDAYREDGLSVSDIIKGAAYRIEWLNGDVLQMHHPFNDTSTSIHITDRANADTNYLFDAVSA
jgi:hypothetical protein